MINLLTLRHLYLPEELSLDVQMCESEKQVKKSITIIQIENSGSQRMGILPVP